MGADTRSAVVDAELRAFDHPNRLLWSTSFRLRRALTNNPEYGDYTEIKLSWQQFRDEWMPMIERNGELIAMDRVRSRLFAFKPSVVQTLVEFEIKQIADRNS
jgi:hypothetical protein